MIITINVNRFFWHISMPSVPTPKKKEPSVKAPLFCFLDIEMHGPREWAVGSLSDIQGVGVF